MNQQFEYTAHLSAPALVILLGLLAVPAKASDAAAADWVERFAYRPPAAAANRALPDSRPSLPDFVFEPRQPGTQLVRVSLPFAEGACPLGPGLIVETDGRRIRPDVRILTLHPTAPQSIRRAILTFPFEFADASPRRFHLAFPIEPMPPAQYATHAGLAAATIGNLSIEVDSEGIRVSSAQDPVWAARFIAPDRTWLVAPTIEVIERGNYYVWMRALIPDRDWPRIIDVRADSLGWIDLRGHLQRLEGCRPDDPPGPVYAHEEVKRFSPDIGWILEVPGRSDAEMKTFSLDSGKSPLLEIGPVEVAFPDARRNRQGTVEANDGAVTYYRARAGDLLPHQAGAWRGAALQVETAAHRIAQPPAGEGRARIAPAAFDAIYYSTVAEELEPWPAIAAAHRFHHETMAGPPLRGPDAGNLTSYPSSGVFGMNRLNHAPAIFEEYYRTGDARLRDVALGWCDNFHDLTIWWGLNREGEFGGTRYNNLAAASTAFERDPAFMWRSDSAISFCTKGYDAFFHAYEETGDPRFACALRWQVDYAAKQIHADRGESRNVGDVRDFVRLYDFTGREDYLEEALRIFRELRTKLSLGDLFDQGGRPLLEAPPFIDDDAFGYKHPFAKPYIVGYALAGLPDLARHRPDEPKLHDVIRASANFVAGTNDPTGGWRYPHPQSSRILNAQGIEHAAQLVNAAQWLETRGEDVGSLLDAIEQVLQSRVAQLDRIGTFLGSIEGWERSTGSLHEGKSLHDLYATPGDRDASRDYAEGLINLGSAPPEGVVYFSRVLDYYLRHRPAERLYHLTPELAQILDRIRPAAQTVSERNYTGYGVEERLPTFSADRVARLDWPLAYDPNRDKDFAAWRSTARKKVLDCLQTPPLRAKFDPVVLAEEDRGSYTARKIVFNVSRDDRVPAYVLIPKGGGPFPAILALHDHGAHFSIGKEKVVRPFDVTPDVLADARHWSEKNYGGRFIGDELAARGFVVFAVDALFWGERGRREGSDHRAQESLAANILQLGMTWVGVITWDDIRSAEFIASLPEVDPGRIGAVGLSMGSHRTWMLSALSDRIAAGVAVCWMGTTEVLTRPGNNQTKGQSAFSMLVPDLRNYLDYPHVASIACPKPMMFFNGSQDGLFPVEGVEAAYTAMKIVWDAQSAGDALRTKIWPVPHVFNLEMQMEAFDWLVHHLR